MATKEKIVQIDEKYDEFMKDFIKEMREALKPRNGAFCCSDHHHPRMQCPREDYI